jgi:23S rRNA pseudouridine2605 synthase
MPPRKKSPSTDRTKRGPIGAGRKPGPPKRAGKPPAGRPRRRPAPTPPSDLPGERLQKVIAAAGIASRRESEQIILEGRVEVDGQVVSELGARVEPHQEIFVDGQRLGKTKLVHYAVNKPVGVVSTARDPSGRPRVIDMLPPDVGRVFNVGRLDLNSEGLILVTNDGELANKLTHPRHGVRKTYEVHVAGEPGTEVLSQLRRGVHLAEGFVKPVEVRIKGNKKHGSVLEMVLEEGRNREVRRLLARVGHKVQRLIRTAVGPIRLGEMPRGASRLLTPEEVRKLRAAVSETPAPRKRAPDPAGQDEVRVLAEAARERKRKAAMGKATHGLKKKPAAPDRSKGKVTKGRKPGPPRKRGGR